jgi:hypothetical protein
VPATLTVSFFILIAFVPFAGAQSLSSQVVTEGSDASLRRLEVGGQVADIRTGCIGQPRCSLPSSGLGAGASLNLNPNFAVDANFNVTPESSTTGATYLVGGHASEFLLGARAEVRARHYGFFLKAQPGYFTWSNVVTKVAFSTPTTFTFSYGKSTRFASAVGAGFEYSPYGRIHLRAEVSDLIIRYPATFYSATSWTNNLQPSIGIYAGVGRPIDWRPPVYRAETAHSFRDAPNSVLFLGSVLAMTADAITTQRSISHGLQEGDPFARPLVKYGWSGQISAMSLEIAAEAVGMYALHRIGQHRVERMVPVGLATTHGIFAYKNTKVSYNTTVN